MNEEIFEGKWNQFKGKVKEKWGKLTDQELTEINGKRDQLLGKLQERYGWQKDRAEEELKNFEKSFRKDRSFKRNENEPYRGDEDISEDKDNFPKRKIG